MIHYFAESLKYQSLNFGASTEYRPLVLWDGKSNVVAVNWDLKSNNFMLYLCNFNPAIDFKDQKYTHITGRTMQNSLQHILTATGQDPNSIVEKMIIRDSLAVSAGFEELSGYVAEQKNIRGFSKLMIFDPASYFAMQELLIELNINFPGYALHAFNEYSCCQKEPERFFLPFETALTFVERIIENAEIKQHSLNLRDPDSLRKYHNRFDVVWDDYGFSKINDYSDASKEFLQKFVREDGLLIIN